MTTTGLTAATAVVAAVAAAVTVQQDKQLNGFEGNGVLSNHGY